MRICPKRLPSIQLYSVRSVRMRLLLLMMCFYSTFACRVLLCIVCTRLRRDMSHFVCAFVLGKCYVLCTTTIMLSQICNGITYIFWISIRRLIIFISLLHFISVLLFALCRAFFCVSSVSFAIVSLWDCAFYCIRCDVISAKTLSEFTYTSSEWHSSEKKEKKMAKIQIVAFGTFSKDIMNYDEHFFSCMFFFLALNRPYYHHATKIVCTLFAACFSFRLHYIYSVGFLCIFLCLSV